MLQMSRKFKFECNCHSGPKLTNYKVGTEVEKNIQAMSLSTLGTDIETMFRQATLCEHQCPTLGTDVATIFTHCLNIVSMSVTNIESNVATMFTRCLNVVSTLVPNIESDVATTFTQC